MRGAAAEAVSVPGAGRVPESQPLLGGGGRCCRGSGGTAPALVWMGCGGLVEGARASGPGGKQTLTGK